MTFWQEVAAGFLSGVFVGWFFLFWYGIFQWYSQATDIVVGYSWSWNGPNCHPNLDIRNRSKSRTYLLADIMYRRSGELAPVWIDRESIWNEELKPGSMNFFNTVVPVKHISSIPEALQLQVIIGLQTGRRFWLKGQGPGQQRMSWIQREAFALRNWMEKRLITMEK
jgi:hypothetical protein